MAAAKTTAAKKTAAKTETSENAYRATGTVEVDGVTYHAGDFLPISDPATIAQFLSIRLVEEGAAK